MENLWSGALNALTTQMLLGQAAMRTMNNFNAVLTDHVMPCFVRAETEDPGSPSDQWDLFMNNITLGIEGFSGGWRDAVKLGMEMSAEQLISLQESLIDGGASYADVTGRQRRAAELLVDEYPKFVEEIGENEFGLHYEDGKYIDCVKSTERLDLFQILPVDPKVTIDPESKPVMIIPPAVLGADILGFLRRIGKSYVDSFARKGVPTFILIMKDIDATAAVRNMTFEEYVLDVREMCQYLFDTYGKQVTINGYCQGGPKAIWTILTGELEGLVDALITCVAPIDGTKSEGLSLFLKNLPEHYCNPRYGMNPDGSYSGPLMSLVYNFKQFGTGNPISGFVNNYRMMRGTVESARKNGGEITFNTTVAAIQYWLRNQIGLPKCFTDMSFASYMTPIQKDGTMPVEWLGKMLNIKDISKYLPNGWLLCYGETDDLVEKEVALDAVDMLPEGSVEVTPFPKGHVAIATSWSHPKSECPLDGTWKDYDQQTYRGPVRFHLDLTTAEEAACALVN